MYNNNNYKFYVIKKYLIKNNLFLKNFELYKKI